MAFPQTPLGLTFKMFLNGAFTDITSRVECGQDQQGFHITAGRKDEAGRVSPLQLTCRLKNGDHFFSYRVPGTTNYGKITRNTRVQLSIGSDVRFDGEIASLELSADGTNNYKYADLVAAGALRRLTASKKPAQSPIYRAVVHASPAAVHYWPLEDDSGSTRAGSGLASGIQLTNDSADLPEFKALDGPVGSAPTGCLKLVNEGVHIGRLSAALTGVSNTAWSVAGWWFDDYSGSAFAPTIVRSYTNGPLGVIEFNINNNGAGGTGIGAFNLGSPTIDPTSFSFLEKATWHHFRFTYSIAGGTITGKLYVNGTLENTVTGAASTLGTINRITIGAASDETGVSSATGYTVAAISHIQIYNSTTPVDQWSAGRGYDGEYAYGRMARLCAEEGISLSITRSDLLPGPLLTGATRMGPQRTAKIFDLFMDIVDTDQGMLIDRRANFGLKYITGPELLNQTGPSFDYSAKVLSNQLKGRDDDQLTANDVTATRYRGAKLRYLIPDGDFFHFTREDPQVNTRNGAGLYEIPIDTNAYLDKQSRQIAAFVANQRSYFTARQPLVSVDMSRSVIAGNAALTAQIQALDCGQYFQVPSPPSWLQPSGEPVECVIEGYHERLAQFRWDFDFNTSPWPAREAELLDTSGSYLIVARDTVQTSIKLANSLGPAWSLVVPYYIQIAGEAMKVTAIVADTPTFIAAGTVAHANNANVTPGFPAGMTADQGQSIFIWAAIRNSGAGTVNLPAGYTRLTDASLNIALFHKYYVAGDVAPTISFTGGVLNADTSAIMFGFSGISRDFASGDTKPVPALYQQLNGSAQNVAYPSCRIPRAAVNVLLLYLFWKQDDATGYATIGDAEMFDASTLTGDDQSIAGDYDIAPAGFIEAGSVVVTGGLAAISRAVLAAFRGSYTLTVERSKNGVVQTQAAGAAVHIWRPGINGL